MVDEAMPLLDEMRRARNDSKTYVVPFQSVEVE
jgi:hypothetical protein